MRGIVARATRVVFTGYRLGGDCLCAGSAQGMDHRTQDSPSVSSRKIQVVTTPRDPYRPHSSRECRRTSNREVAASLERITRLPDLELRESQDPGTETCRNIKRPKGSSSSRFSSEEGVSSRPTGSTG